jgi:cytochrome c biogenesis protein CcdA/thiol-disulfide isomerase/thioredoxin
VVYLVVVAFVAGMVTAVSPCVLPVLPIVFAGGATGSRRRPYAIVGGLVLGFTLFTLTASAILSALGLPGDLLRNIAIGVVLLAALSLVWPRLADLAGRPFHALARRSPGEAGGVVLGLSLGLLFTPCAGPIIAAIAALAATRRYSVDSVIVTLAYAAGAGLVLLALAIAARRGLSLVLVKRRATVVRRALGGVIAGVAVLMILGLDTRLATHVPGYTRALQGLEESAAAQSRVAKLVGGGRPARREAAAGKLDDYGQAPGFANIGGWINSTPLSLEGNLRGKVVLIDFWTYSCVNCLRTLPFLKRWDAAYRADGLVIVGVHTPEFAFERVPSNVRRAVSDLGVRYPVALDSDYGTWNRWGNQYWPAEYLVDRRGHVRYVHFGEGEYDRSERAIRTLLAENSLPAPVSATVADTTPHGGQSPETYLGYERIAYYAGSPIRRGKAARYEIPGFIALPGFAYGGEWKVEAERAVAGRDARLRIVYRGVKVHLVLGTSSGAKTVRVRVDGTRYPDVTVTRDRLYTLADIPGVGPARDHNLELDFDPGTEAYAFTFG